MLRFLKAGAGVLHGSSSRPVDLLAAPGIVRAQDATIKIGYIGSLSGIRGIFGETEPWRIDQMTARLAQGLTVGGKTYGEFRALSSLSLTVEAGKSTLMRVLTGLMGGWSGAVTVGGAAVVPGNPQAAAAQGLVLAPEGRLLFDSLTVEEILFQGLTLGGLYGTIGAGLALSYGILKVVQLAHGAFICWWPLACRSSCATVGSRRWALICAGWGP